MSPHTNVGIELPLIEVTRLRWSMIVSLCTAASVPSQIPMARMATKDSTASSRVAGERGHRRRGPPRAGPARPTELLLGQGVVVLPAVHGVPVPAAHPRPHHLELGLLRGPDARDIVVRDLGQLPVQVLPLGRIR